MLFLTPYRQCSYDMLSVRVYGAAEPAPYTAVVGF